MKQQPANSNSYQRKVVYAISSVVLFLFIYLLLIAFGFFLIGLSISGAAFLMSLHGGFITLMLGLGLIGMSVMVTIFLFKFIFAKHQTDRSHLIEVTKEQEPKLFELIEEIVRDVNTDFPKRVYLSADVNAAVFYDSSFWSMFLPVKKNLQIGIGLVNTVSIVEFKAILAHEFGHFSQKSMKVGSYVSSVNQMIFNMVNDNESYNNFVNQWANISTYFSFFVVIAVKIIGQIQLILKKLYEIVNLSYLQLSREMEFDADAIAAQAVGSQALSESLMRISLADYCYGSTIDYYFTKVEQKISTENLYPQQKFVVDFVAHQQGLPLKNGLPQITFEYLNKFSKSKLNLVEDWNSHPSIEERVDRLNRLNIPIKNNDTNPAASVFKNMEEIEKTFTKKIFLLPQYSSRPVDITAEQFVEGYTKEFASNSLGKLYNGYYDFKNPSIVEMQGISEVYDCTKEEIKELFSNKHVSDVHTVAVLESDINVLNQISKQEIKIKWFQYDGIKYFYRKADLIANELKVEVQKLKEEILKNDAHIYSCFHFFAGQQGKLDELKKRYATMDDASKVFEQKAKAYEALVKETGFMSEVHAFRVIEGFLTTIYRLEKPFKEEIADILNNPLFEKELTTEIKEVFSTYLSKDWEYFRISEYNNKAVEQLFNALRLYQYLLSQLIFNNKKALLDYQVELLDSHL